MSKLVVHAEIDLDTTLVHIADAPELESSEAVFEGLSQIAAAKAEANRVLDEVVAAELQVKQAINDKAKALYGPNWEAIKGERFKIVRYRTGSIYELAGEADPEFLKVTTTVDSDAVDKYVTERETLPEGIEINPNRGETIRITVQR